jgi:hypothetical protein
MSTTMKMQTTDGTEIFVGNTGDFFALEQRSLGVLVYYSRTEKDVDAYLALAKSRGQTSLPDRKTLLGDTCSLKAGNVYCTGDCPSSKSCTTTFNGNLSYCGCK